MPSAPASFPRQHFPATLRSRIEKAPTVNTGDILDNQLVYYLPKQKVQVTLTYSIFKHSIVPIPALTDKLTPDKFDDKTRTDPGAIWLDALIVKSPQVELISVPDVNLKFGVLLNQLNGVTTDTTASIKIADNGILQSVGATFNDKLASIITHIANTAINVGATASKLAMASTTAKTIDEVEYLGDVTLVKTLDLESGKVVTSAGASDKSDSGKSTKNSDKDGEQKGSDQGAKKASQPSSGARTSKPDLSSSVDTNPVTAHLSRSQSTARGNQLALPTAVLQLPVLMAAEVSSPANTSATTGEQYSPVTATGAICPDRDLIESSDSDANLIKYFITTAVKAADSKDWGVYAQPIDNTKLQVDLPSHIYLALRDPAGNTADPSKPKGVGLTTLDGPTCEDVDRFMNYEFPKKKDSKRGARIFDGLIARNPSTVQLDVWQADHNGNSQLCFRQNTALAQTGGFLRFSMTKKTWTNTNRSIDVNALGAVTSLGSGHTSPAETITKMLDDISGNLAKAVP